MNPKISLVFLYWNAPEWTLKSLDSLIKYMTVPFEIIIVNNGSKNDLVKEVENKSKILSHMDNCTKCEIINHSENLGVTKGFNSGLRIINPETEYVSMFANDWVITPNWDTLMMDALESHPRYGMMTSCTNWGAGSMMTDPNNPIKWKQQVHLQIEDANFWEAVDRNATEKTSW